MTAAASSPDSRLRAWLADPEPHGALQATVQQAWQGWLAYKSHPLGMVGLGLIALLVFTAAAAPLLTGYDPIAQDMQQRLLAPSAAHWFGTDNFGRDVFSRVVYGARTTLYIVMLVTILVAPIGLMIGAIAGYRGGIIDEALMRVTDIFLSFPGLVLALGFAAALGPGITNAIIAISLTAWPPIARLARAEALSLRQADYIAAVRAAGRVVAAHHRAAYPADVPAFGHRPCDAQHGRRDPDGRRARLPRARGAAAVARMGLDGIGRAAVHAR